MTILSERHAEAATVMLMYGTRPEAIKMAPLITAMKISGTLTPVVVQTGQHRELVSQVHQMFGITADHIVDSFEPGLDLATMSSRVILGSSSVIEQVRPDVLVVQGDTTSACMAGLAAFYQGVPVVHLEAGLRTGDLRNPFPEEANRAILGRLAELHLAPTRSAKENLLREGVPEEAIRVIGNTVIDALYQVLENQPPIRDASLRALLASVPSGSGHRLITVTTHRRESWGEPMQRVFSAVSRLAMRHMDCDFIVPLHPNPTVRDAADRSLARLPNVHRLEPLSYADFCRLISASALILSDSGGVQEEAPAVGVPVLVLRETTERAEAVEAGVARLVGTDPAVIEPAVSEELARTSSPGAREHMVSPFGDGLAAQRAVVAIEVLLRGGRWPGDFEPAAHLVDVSALSTELALGSDRS